MIAIMGSNSSVSRALVERLPADEEICSFEGSPPICDRYFIASGFLANNGMTIGQQHGTYLAKSWSDNFTAIAAICDDLIERNDSARICIMGSESGIVGSFDMAYAGAKAALHLYIETKRLRHRDQQLVGIAPTIIWDSGMTQRRPDVSALHGRGSTRRLGRWLTAREVAEAAFFALYVDRGYLTNTIIRMNGGQW